MELFPVKPPKAERPTRHGTAFVVRRPDGAILLRRRPPKGLLGGMSEVPGSDWATKAGKAATGPETGLETGDAVVRPSLTRDWRRLNEVVEPTFTHFHRILAVEIGRTDARADAPEGHWWSRPNEWDDEALPSVMRKVIDAVRANAIPVVFSESTISDKPALQVAKETGAAYGGVLYVDSLSEEGGPVPTYLDLLRVTSQTIARGLAPAGG
jgi:hypothetical protein